MTATWRTSIFAGASGADGAFYHTCQQRDGEPVWLELSCIHWAILSSVWGVPMPEFSVRTRKKQEMVDITERVADLVTQSGVSDGICLVYVPHATAAVAINENADPNVCEDILDALANVIPEGRWRHDRIDNNAAAHIKATILGPGQTVPVRGSRLLLGTWQSLMLVELDGPRARTVIVEVR